LDESNDLGLSSSFHRKCRIIHGKNDFAEVFKNLARYRSENNFVGPK